MSTGYVKHPNRCRASQSDIYSYSGTHVYGPEAEMVSCPDCGKDLQLLKDRRGVRRVIPTHNKKREAAK